MYVSTRLNSFTVRACIFIIANERAIVKQGGLVIQQISEPHTDFMNKW